MGANFVRFLFLNAEGAMRVSMVLSVRPVPLIRVRKLAPPFAPDPVKRNSVEPRHLSVSSTSNRAC
jgi:hypothetical protein